MCLDSVHIQKIGPIPFQIIEQKLVQHCETNIDADACKGSKVVFLTNYCSDICYVRLTDAGVLAPKHGVGVGMVEAGHFYGDCQDWGGQKEKGKDNVIDCHGQALTGSHRL